MDIQYGNNSIEIRLKEDQLPTSGAGGKRSRKSWSHEKKDGGSPKKKFMRLPKRKSGKYFKKGAEAPPPNKMIVEEGHEVIEPSNQVRNRPNQLVPDWLITNHVT